MFTKKNQRTKKMELWFRLQFAFTPEARAFVKRSVAQRYRKPRKVKV